MTGDKPQDLIRGWKRIRNRLPGAVGHTARSFFRKSFRNQGFDSGSGIRQWQKRSANASRNKGRAILIDSGRLRNSIRIIRSDRRRVVVGSTLPYASAHNFGYSQSKRVKIRSHIRRTKRGTHRVKAHSRNANFRLPKRQFIGQSSSLNREINRTIVREMKKIL